MCVRRGGESGQCRLLARALERELGGFLGGAMWRQGCLRRRKQKADEGRGGEPLDQGRFREQGRCGAMAIFCSSKT